MDEPIRRALDGIAKAVASKPPDGPVILSDEYLSTLKLAEELPANRTGTDKSWTERALSTWMAAVARSRRNSTE